ncbi:MAG: DUF5677 domain-containing protein [Candidatus Hatepunaea meridiana]|nr:DUF5677 domain-containing protein [Candidatus Hatepunaea meridiana]
MCEESLKGILERDLAVVLLKPHVEKPIKGLEIEINYATHLLGRLSKTCKDIYSKPPLLLLRHIIEMVDAISVMISNSVVIPTRLLLRSEFEALMSILYILQDRSTYEFRSKSFHYFAWKTRLRNTRIIRDLQVDNRVNPEHRDMAVWLDQHFNLDDDITVLEKLLSSPKYTDIKNEVSKNAKNWFSLRGGPNNLEFLADCVGQRTQYQLLYRKWSKGTHAVELDDQITLEDEIETIRPLRDGTEFNGNIELAHYFLLMAMYELIKYYRPDEKEVFYRNKLAQLSDDKKKSLKAFSAKYN